MYFAMVSSIESTERSHLNNLTADDLKQLWKTASNPGTKLVTHHLMHLFLPTTGNDFTSYIQPKFINEAVMYRVHEELLRIDIKDRIVDLQRNDAVSNGRHNKALDKINYETVVADLLCSPLRSNDWYAREAVKSSSGQWTHIEIPLLRKGPIMYNPIKFSQWIQLMLYKPNRHNFECFDMMYKVDCNDAVCIQVTRQNDGIHEFTAHHLKSSNMFVAFLIQHHARWCFVFLARFVKQAPDV